MGWEQITHDEQVAKGFRGTRENERWDERQLVTADEWETLTPGSRHALNEYVREHNRVAMELREAQSERDMLLACIRGTWPEAYSVLYAGLTRHWEREMLERFCLHILGGDDAQARFATIARLTEELATEKREYSTQLRISKALYGHWRKMRDELERERELRLEYEKRVAVAESTLSDREVLCAWCGHALLDCVHAGDCTARKTPNQATEKPATGTGTPKPDSDTPEVPNPPQSGLESKDLIEARRAQLRGECDECGGRAEGGECENGCRGWVQFRPGVEDAKHPPESPTFDSAGCPTDETTDAIIHWPGDDLPGLFAFIDEAWNRDYGSMDDLRVYATGGWSGNEELINSLKLNESFAWAQTWQSSKRGGRHVFRLLEVSDA